VQNVSYESSCFYILEVHMQLHSLIFLHRAITVYCMEQFLVLRTIQCYSTILSKHLFDPVCFIVVEKCSSPNTLQANVG
jgi:hypothetical protein